MALVIDECGNKSFLHLNTSLSVGFFQSVTLGRLKVGEGVGEGEYIVFQLRFRTRFPVP